MKHRAQAAPAASSLGQGAALLQAVVERERSGRLGYSASRLAEHTGIERSRVSRLTQELDDLGFVQRAEGGVFRAGDAYFALARARQEAWMRRARADLRRLASRFPVTLRITMPDGPRAVLMRFESAPGSPETATFPGMVTPIWCTGGGRALLWEDGEDQLGARLSGVEFVGVGGPRAPRTVGEVHARMERDRAVGFVTAEEEFEYGILELAAPVTIDGRVVAAVSAACRVDQGIDRVALAEAVRSVAGELGRVPAEPPAQPER